MSDAPNALDSALEGFLRRRDADSTREAYRRELLRFLAWAQGRASHEILFDYRDALRERGLGPTTIRWRTTVVRAFLSFAQDQGVLETESVGDFRPPRGVSGFAPRVLTERERARLLAAPDRRTRRGKRDAAVLVCLAVGGLRAGEVCGLNPSDMTFQGSQALLHVLGKGRKQRLVAISTEHTAVLKSYLGAWPQAEGEGEGLFRCGQPGHEGKRMTVASIDYLVRMSARAAGLTRVSAHVLRHTAASLAIEAGEPLHRLRDRLGHSSVLITSRYLHAS